MGMSRAMNLHLRIRIAHTDIVNCNKNSTNITKWTSFRQQTHSRKVRTQGADFKTGQLLLNLVVDALVRCKIDGDDFGSYVVNGLWKNEDGSKRRSV